MVTKIPPSSGSALWSHLECLGAQPLYLAGTLYVPCERYMNIYCNYLTNTFPNHLSSSVNFVRCRMRVLYLLALCWCEGAVPPRIVWCFPDEIKIHLPTFPLNTRTHTPIHRARTRDETNADRAVRLSKAQPSTWRLLSGGFQLAAALSPQAVSLTTRVKSVLREWLLFHLWKHHKVKGWEETWFRTK